MAFLRRKTVYCISDKNMDNSQRIAFSAVCLTTASLSGYGAIIQLRAWYRQLKDCESRRSPSSSPPVVFSLALADLFACIGVIGMSILFLTLKHPTEDPLKPDRWIPAEDWYWMLGVPVEAFTMFAYISSYFWTLVYSLDICLQVYNKNKSISMWTYHIICWGAPAWLVAWGEYGFLVHTITPRYCSDGEKAFLHYAVCYVPLLFVTLVLPIIYIIAFRRIHHNVLGAHAMYTNTERQILAGVKRKFSFIVLVFMLCWLVNVIDGFHDLGRDKDDYHIHFPVWIIEAIVNPLQGLLNCIVYGQAREMVRCCKCQDSYPETNYIPWVDTTPTSETSGSFLVNSQDVIEYSRTASRVLIDADQVPDRALVRSPSPYRPAQLTFVPRLLGEPNRT